MVKAVNSEDLEAAVLANPATIVKKLCHTTILHEQKRIGKVSVAENGSCTTLSPDNLQHVVC